MTRSEQWQAAKRLPFHNELDSILSFFNPHTQTGTLDKPTRLNNRGYLIATAKGRTYSVHRLVWMKANNRFVPKGLEINHIDGNKQNNCIDNLEAVTHTENMQHAIHTLGYTFGGRLPFQKKNVGKSIVGPW